ncbi:MAG: HDIG domain-containing metalloprotein, partial [bacterium]
MLLEAYLSLQKYRVIKAYNGEEALKLISDNVSNQNLINHMLATEAIMKALAAHFGEDEETWALTGLLHDVDYDTTKDDPTRHSLLG